MTVATQQTIFNYPSASGTAFPYQCRVLDAGDLKVSVDGVLKTFGVDYAVSGVNSDTGGSVLFNTPLVSRTVRIWRAVALQRTTDYQIGGDFPAQVVNRDFDRLVMAMQDIINGSVESANALRVPAGETILALPDAATRGGKLLGFAQTAAADPVALVLPDAAGATALDLALRNAGLFSEGAGQLGFGVSNAYAASTVGKKLQQRVDLRDYADLPAAIAAIGATPTELVIASAVSLAANSTVPTTTTLRFERGGVITTTGYTLNVNGPFVSPRAQCIAGTGKIVFGAASSVVLLPEWWGVKGDAAIDGSSGTDSTAGANACIAASTDTGLVSGVAIHAIEWGAGNFLIGNLVWPAASTATFAGHEVCNFIVKTGTVGIVMTDNGNAAKLHLRGGFAIYARSVAGLTYGTRFGYNGVQFGVEGDIGDVWVRDLNGAAAVWGIDVNGNVGKFGDLMAYSCTRGVRIAGVANMATTIIAYAPTIAGVDLTLTAADGIEIEAPANGCVPLKFTGNASVRNLILSLANGTTIPHLVELGASATTWNIDGFNLAFGNTPAGITVSGGNMKRADGTFFGGNATAGSRDGEGNYSSNSAGQRLQCFMLTIANNGGVIQHKITDPGANGATNFAAKISGASATFANTVNGADGSTAMTSGGKIGSATASIFWLDTPDQKQADSLLAASVQSNSSGAALTVIAGFASISINGVTRNRLYFQLLNATTGVGTSIITANIASGKAIQIACNGFLG